MQREGENPAGEGEEGVQIGEGENPASFFIGINMVRGQMPTRDQLTQVFARYGHSVQVCFMSANLQADLQLRSAHEFVLKRSISLTCSGSNQCSRV